MANKESSFRDMYSRWAEQESRRKAQEALNRQAELKSILDALRAEGASDAVLKEVARQYMATGEFNVPEKPAAKPEATPVLPTSNPTTQRANPPAQREGSVLEDLALGLRRGAANVTSGVLGLPVNLTNLIIDPLPFRALRYAEEKLTGRESKITPATIGISPLEQPEVVRGMQEQIAISRRQDFEDTASDELKRQMQEYEETSGIFGTLSLLARRPRLLSYLATEQVPQLVMGRVPGSTGGTIVAQSALAGSSNAADVAQELEDKVASGEISREKR